MNAMFNWFKRKDTFIIVAVFSIPVCAADHKGILYFYLFENERGERKEEHAVTIECKDNMKAISLWHEKIYPWLKGENFSDIPSYWDKMCEKRWDRIKIMYKSLNRV